MLLPNCIECDSSFDDFYALGMHMSRAHDSQMIVDLGEMLVTKKHPANTEDTTRLEGKTRQIFQKAKGGTVRFGQDSDSVVHYCEGEFTLCGRNDMIAYQTVLKEDLKGKYIENICGMCQGVAEKTRNPDFFGIPEGSIQTEV